MRLHCTTYNGRFYEIKCLGLFFIPAVRFEPGMAGFEARTLPLSFAVPHINIWLKEQISKISSTAHLKLSFENKCLYNLFLASNIYKLFCLSKIIYKCYFLALFLFFIFYWTLIFLNKFQESILDIFLIQKFALK